MTELGTGEPLDFLFVDRSSSGDVGELGISDEIVFVYRKTPQSRFFSFSWRIFMDTPVDAFNQELLEEDIIFPQDGDVFRMVNNIPFSERDRYRFSTTAQSLDENAPSAVLDEVKVVPNPYVVASVLEEQPFLRGRGERFIRFINVPINSTVRIYTANGDFVRELRQSGGSDGVVYWDLLTKDDLEVAFGLYLYHIDAPGIGEKTGQFAIVN